MRSITRTDHSRIETSSRPASSTAKRERFPFFSRALQSAPRQLRGVVGVTLAWVAMWTSLSIPGIVSFLSVPAPPQLTWTHRLHAVGSMLIFPARFGLVFGLSFCFLMMLAVRVTPSLRKLPLLGVSAIGGFAVLLTAAPLGWAGSSLSGAVQTWIIGAVMTAAVIGVANRSRADALEVHEALTKSDASDSVFDRIRGRLRMP